MSKDDPKYIPDSELTPDKVMQNKFSKIQKPKPGSLLIQINAESPFLEQMSPKEYDWKFPDTLKRKLRYITYRDLYDRNYWIVDGFDQGMDFMLYQTSPEISHGFAGVVIVDDTHVDPSKPLTYR